MPIRVVTVMIVVLEDLELIVRVATIKPCYDPNATVQARLAG